MQLLHQWFFLVLQKSYSLSFKKFLNVTLSFKFVTDDILDEYLIKSNNSFECRTIINFYGHFSVVKLN